MKKLFILLMMCIPFVAMAKDVRIKVKTDNGLVQQYADSILSIKFNPEYTKCFIIAEITNNTKGRIEIEWENAKFESEKVIFSDDSPLTMGNKKENEVIYSGDKLKKTFTSKKFYSNRLLEVFSIFSKSTIKKNGGELKRTLILPVIHNGETTDYRFELIFVIE